MPCNRLHFSHSFVTASIPFFSRITSSEAAYKLCRVKAVSTGPKGVPYIHTSDGRTIRYPDPDAKVHL